MTWNYRIVKFNDEPASASETGEYYEIKEVFYDFEDKPIGYSDAVCGSDTYEGLFKCMSMMQSAHAKPVIDEEEFYRTDFKQENDDAVH
jgi:hypothetical protein